jgi:hypothetical protein
VKASSTGSSFIFFATASAFALRVDGVNLKHPLRQIETNLLALRQRPRFPGA